jgi:chaperonin GroES
MQGAENREQRAENEETVHDIVQLTPRDGARRTFDMSLATKLETEKPEPIRRRATGFMPMSGQVLVRLCTEEEMSESGLLYIPGTAQEKPVEGVILAASAGRFDALGRWCPSEVEAGDRCLFGKYSGAKLVLRGEECRLMQESELLGLIR